MKMLFCENGYQDRFNALCDWIRQEKKGTQPEMADVFQFSESTVKRYLKYVEAAAAKKNVRLIQNRKDNTYSFSPKGTLKIEINLIWIPDEE
jgi:DeoR/GlpR family transcriptional regulator of sugar metabolism